MVSVNSHKLKPEKPNKNQKYHRQLRKIAKLLRYAEMCVVLVLISRLSIQLPTAVKSTSEYLRAFVSPRLVFLIGNLIIIVLFAQFGQFAATNAQQPDLYHEFLRNSFMNHKIQSDKDNLSIKGQRIHGYPVKQNMEKQSTEKQSMEKQSTETGDGTKKAEELLNHKIHADENKIGMKGKRIIDGCLINCSEKQSREKQSTEKQSTKTGDIIKRAEKHSTKTKIGLEIKDYRRCKSDIVRKMESENRNGEGERVLKRCETENKERSSYPEDGMSNDEFRRAVEAFIARQQRNRTQELCYITT